MRIKAKITEKKVTTVVMNFELSRGEYELLLKSVRLCINMRAPTEFERNELKILLDDLSNTETD